MIVLLSFNELYVCALAHDDAIWTAAWGKSEADGSETIVTGSLDDMVKVWKWWARSFYFNIYITDL